LTLSWPPNTTVSDNASWRRFRRVESVHGHRLPTLGSSLVYGSPKFQLRFCRAKTTLIRSALFCGDAACHAILLEKHGGRLSRQERSVAEDEFLKPEMPESVRNLSVLLYGVVRLSRKRHARRRNKIGCFSD
jgi:hypothetical protein